MGLSSSWISYQLSCPEFDFRKTDNKRKKKTFVLDSGSEKNVSSLFDNKNGLYIESSVGAVISLSFASVLAVFFFFLGSRIFFFEISVGYYLSWIQYS